MVNHFRIKLCFIAIAICFAMAGEATAQSQAQPPIMVNGSNNETTKAELDLLSDTAGNDSLIIMIARLGNREAHRSLNRRRLKAASSYLKIVRAVPEQRIVTAEGERISGPGRVEVYLRDSLFMVFTLERNRNFAGEQ